MMNRRKFCMTLAAVASGIFSGNAYAQEQEKSVKKLPAPAKEGGMPIMKALSNRKTTRGPYNKKPITNETLSNLLWAAWGINRPDGKRTAPSALNSQEVNLYVVMQDGVWLFDAKNHQLLQETGKDYRNKVGGGTIVFVYTAPDGAWPGMHVGSIYQNANLYASSIGLGSHVHAGSSDGLNDIIGLPVGYRFWIAHSFGYTG